MNMERKKYEVICVQGSTSSEYVVQSDLSCDDAIMIGKLLSVEIKKVKANNHDYFWREQNEYKS